MIATIMAVLSDRTKLLIIILTSLTLLFGGLSSYQYFKNQKLETTIKENSITLKKEKLNHEKTTNAYKGCKNSIEKLIISNQKKYTVIKEYEKNLGKGEDDEIDTIDDFIDFANRMQ